MGASFLLPAHSVRIHSFTVTLIYGLAYSIAIPICPNFLIYTLKFFLFYITKKLPSVLGRKESFLAFHFYPHLNHSVLLHITYSVWVDFSILLTIYQVPCVPKSWIKMLWNLSSHKSCWFYIVWTVFQSNRL